MSRLVEKILVRGLRSFSRSQPAHEPHLSFCTARLRCRALRRRRSLPLGGAPRFIVAFRLRDWVVRLRSPFQANERRIYAYPNCLRFNLETRIAESLRFADPSSVDFGNTRDHSFHLATSFSRDDNSPRFDRG